MNVIDIHKERLKKLIKVSCQVSNLSTDIGIKLFNDLCDFLKKNNVELSELDNGEIGVLGLILKKPRTLNQIADAWDLRERKDLEGLATCIHLLEKKQLIQTSPVFEFPDLEPNDWRVSIKDYQEENHLEIIPNPEPKPKLGANILEFKKND